MTETEMLEALKIDLGITATAYDNRFKQLLKAAQKEIEKEGVTLDITDIDHAQTVIMYAAWMWRKRDTGEGMPRMIRYQLNNMVFHEHLAESE